MTDQDNSPPDLLWWEKTVEYAYLYATFLAKTDQVVPFSGPLERDTGDALVKSGSRFGIIEFKRDEASLSTEAKKFIEAYEVHWHHLRDMRNWGMEIEPGHEPHVIVFGEAEKHGDDYVLKTIQKDYWIPEDKLTQVKTIDRERFIHYSTFLAMARKPSESGNFGGGVAIGYGESGSVQSCIDLEQLLNHLHPERRKELEHQYLPGRRR